MEIQTDKLKLIKLVDDAYQGSLCLPEFQRDFVWSVDSVADLLRSILRGYYIGSILILHCTPDSPPFAPVSFRGVKNIPTPKMLILDGQQRLTSLIYALTAPELKLKGSQQSRWYYYIDLGLLHENINDDAMIMALSPRDLDDLENPDIQYSKRLLPCTSLFSWKDFDNWLYGFEDWLRENEKENLEVFRKEWRESWRSVINRFLEFQIPVVQLPTVHDTDTEAIGRICAIFEKLNSTGVELSVYDLLTARLYRSKTFLHDLWDDACNKNKLLKEWSKGKADTNKFGVLVLRTLSLLRNLDPKPSNLINLKSENFEKDWKRASLAINRALEIITFVGDNGFGVFNPKYLPGYGLIPVLAALRAEIEERKLGQKARDDLRRWYWCNVFLERYSSSVESKSIKDYREMMSYWLNNGVEPTVFLEARQRIGSNGYTVRTSASNQSVVYSGIFCLLALNGAKDWKRGENIQLQNLQDHHIFPKNYLKKYDITKQNIVNSIINRTLISDETNREISDKSPANYLTPDIAKWMNAHFIDEDAREYMELADDESDKNDIADLYENFLSIREQAIITQIRHVCGISSLVD